MKFTQTEDQKIFFSSDPHHEHKNIVAGVTSWIKAEEWPTPYQEWKDEEARKAFCKLHGIRDFPTIEKMNSTMINRFNERVTENDILFLLGDIGFGSKSSVVNFLTRLRCKNVHLTFGNHDKNIIRNEDGVQGYFKSCAFKREIYVDGQFIILDHYAHRVWNKSHRGSWMLYGHSHASLPDDPNALSIDVGVDTNDMYPYSFDDIKKIMAKKTYKPIDHHGKE